MAAFTTPHFYHISSYNEYRRALAFREALVSTSEKDPLFWSSVVHFLYTFTDSPLRSWIDLGKTRVLHDFDQVLSAFRETHPDVDAFLDTVDAFVENPEAYIPTAAAPVWKMETYFGFNPCGDVELLIMMFNVYRKRRDWKLERAIWNLDAKALVRSPNKSNRFVVRMVGETGCPGLIDLVYGKTEYDLFLLGFLAEGGHLEQLQRLVGMEPDPDELKQILIGAVDGGRKHVLDAYLHLLPQDKEHQEQAMHLVKACVEGGHQHLYPRLIRVLSRGFDSESLTNAYFNGIGSCKSGATVEKYLRKTPPTLTQWWLILMGAAYSCFKLDFDTFRWLFNQIPDGVFTEETLRASRRGPYGYSDLVDRMIVERMKSIIVKE